MNRTEFVTITTIILFGVFVLGWFASWLIGRLTRPSLADLSELERKVRDTERERDKAISLLKERDMMAGQRVGLVLSGGNIDRPLYAAVLGEA